MLRADKQKPDDEGSIPNEGGCRPFQHSLKQDELGASKKGKFLMVREEDTYQLIQKIVSHLKQISHLNNGPIIIAKTKLLTKLLNYFLAQSSDKKACSSLFNQKLLHTKEGILGELAICERSIPDSSQAEEHLTELMHSSIQLYGLHNEGKIMNYVNMNLRQLVFNGFVEFVQSVVVKSKEVKPMSKEAVGHLLARVYGVILEVNKGSVVENYCTVRAMCDLILTITSVYTIDFTKHIIKMAERHSQSEPLYTTFLSSLLMIHHFKLSEKTLNIPAFDSTRAIYEQHKYYKNYQYLLEKYGSEDEEELRISELYLNPEKRDGEVPWELLIIRNAVKIDLSNLVQSQGIYSIFCNLIRYVLFNVCSEECTEIALLILDNHAELDHDKMNILMVSELLKAITRVNNRGNRLPSNQSLKCLHRLVTTLKKVFKLEDIENMSLLIEVTSMVRNIVVLERPKADSQIVNTAAELIKVCFPQLKHDIRTENMEIVLEVLSSLIETDVSCKFFEIYLELVYLSAKVRGMYTVVCESRLFKLTRRQEINKISWSQTQRHEILVYMLNRGLFNGQVVARCWQLLKKSVDSSETDFGMLVVRLFEYLQSQLMEGRIEGNSGYRYEEFLEHQIDCTRELMGQMQTELDSTLLISTLVNQFEVLQMFQIYMLTNLTAYESGCREGQKVELRGFGEFSIQLFRFLDEKKWTLNIEGNGIQARLKEVWGSCYLLQLITLAAAPRVSPQGSRSSSNQQDLLTKFYRMKVLFSDSKQKETSMNQWYRILLSQISRTTPLAQGTESNRVY